jgi:hypothetical protein
VNRIQQAYRDVSEFEKAATEVGLSSSDLQKVTGLMSEPNGLALRLFLAIGEEKSPTAQWMAEQEYANRPPHTCYRNDSFCIAHLFGLSDEKKAESAAWVIENGIGGYYETITHAGFELSELLHVLGAMPEPVIARSYSALRDDRIRRMATVLGVPDRTVEDAAENVIRWSLVQGYGVECITTTFSADSPIDIAEAERLASAYLPREKQQELRRAFDEARRNVVSRSEKLSMMVSTPTRV